MKTSFLMTMSDSEFAAWLASYQRERTPEEVAQAEQAHDEAEGPYVPHEHRSYYGEAGH